MATYTENYNLKMPSGQDAPDVEDFNTNAEIIDTVLKAHSDNTADEYSPNETYTAGRLVIQNNALWKAKRDISVAETWTPDHWESTTLAAELSALNSSLDGKLPLISLNSATADNYRDGARAIYGEIRYGRGRSFGIEYQYTAGDKTYGAQLIINYTDGVMLRKLEDSVWGEWTAIS